MATDVPITQALERAEDVDSVRPGAERSRRLMLLVVVSASAGVIHAKALVDHADHYLLSRSSSGC